MIPDYQGLLGTETKPLTREQSDNFIRLTMMAMQDPTGDTPLKNIAKPEAIPKEGEPQTLGELFDKQLASNFGYQVFIKRLAWAKVPVHPCLRLFLVQLCTSPGECVMWAYTCALIYDKLGRKGPVTLQQWVDEFPMGVPTDKELEARWDAQKRVLTKEERAAQEEMEKKIEALQAAARTELEALAATAPKGDVETEPTEEQIKAHNAALEAWEAENIPKAEAIQARLTEQIKALGPQDRSAMPGGSDNWLDYAQQWPTLREPAGAAV